MYSFFFTNVQIHAHFSNQYLSHSCTHIHELLIFLRFGIVTSSVNHVAWLTAFRLLIEVGRDARLYIFAAKRVWVSWTDDFACICVCVCVRTFVWAHARVFCMLMCEYGCFVWSVCLLRRRIPSSWECISKLVRFERQRSVYRMRANQSKFLCYILCVSSWCKIPNKKPTSFFSLAKQPNFLLLLLLLFCFYFYFHFCFLINGKNTNLEFECVYRCARRSDKALSRGKN